MTFKEIVTQVVEWLQHDGRVSYLALQLQFNLDDNDLANLKEALAFSHPQACDEDGRGLVWTGDPPAPTQNSRSETDWEIMAHMPLSAICSCYPNLDTTQDFIMLMTRH